MIVDYDECVTPLGITRYLINSPVLTDACWNLLSEPQWADQIILSEWIAVFLLTCLFEAPFLWLALAHRTARSWRERAISFLSASVLTNLATHPAVYFAIPFATHALQSSHATTILVGESFAPLAEALLLWRFWKLRPGLAFSRITVGNLFSWWIGAYVGPRIS